LARVQQVPSRQWGLSAQYLRPIARSHTLLTGADFAQVTGESDDVIFTAAQPSSLVNAGGLDRSTGVFVEDIARINRRWLVTGIFRFDDWQTAQDINARSTGLGTFVADLPSEALGLGRVIAFTFYWQEERSWEGTNYSVVVER